MNDPKKKRTRGRPKEKQSIDHDALLTTVTKCFARNGYGGVTISQLAKEAGVADSLLNYHYGNKEGIWKRGLRHTGGKILKELNQLAPLVKNLPGMEQLKIFNRKIVYISASYPEFQQIVVQEMFAHSDRSKWLIEELLVPIYAHHERIRKAEQTKGTIKDIPAANMVSFIFGAITTLFARSYQMQAQFGIDAFDKAEIDKHADIINDLIFNGLAQKDVIIEEDE
ncbi:MAG: TetR/AcrR family transcriptional regulator [Chitinophagales bacterium]